jgi:hypothetical protein
VEAVAKVLPVARNKGNLFLRCDIVRGMSLTNAWLTQPMPWEFFKQH